MDQVTHQVPSLWWFFSFYTPTCQKKSFFTLRLWVGIRSQLLAQVHPCSFFLQINSGANAVPSLLSSCSAAAAVSSPLWAHMRTAPLWHAGLLVALVALQSSFLQAATWLRRRWGRCWANVFQHFFLCIYHRAIAFLQPGLLLLQLPVQTPDGTQQQEPPVHSQLEPVLLLFLLFLIF